MQNPLLKCHACAVPGCERSAAVEVRLFDVYLAEQEVFDERDHTCPFLCGPHMVENEQQAEGERRPRGHVTYPYSNQGEAQGFTIYRKLQ